MSIVRYTISIWVESPATSGPERSSGVVASAELVEHDTYKGLHTLKAPLRAKLPSGLSLEVTCERIATGHFHVGVSHEERLHMMGKYSGTFDVRLLPEGHTSYVLSVVAQG